jgi:type IV secretion system protein VirB10
MLYVAHELKEGALPPTPKEDTFTVMPGSFVPCQIETAMNSDIGNAVFVAVVTSTVYDTATGRQSLIPQSSKIVGEGKGESLVYGNELLRTVSLSLSRRQDTAPIELGDAPVTDQQGIGGLASEVDNHYWRLLGAIFIGGALRGGTQAVTTAVASTGPVGAIGGGIAQSGQQTVQQTVGPALSTKPTIKVFAGQLCNIILTKPLHLTVAR